MAWSISLVLTLLDEGQVNEIRAENRTRVSFKMSGWCLVGVCGAKGATKEGV